MGGLRGVHISGTVNEAIRAKLRQTYFLERNFRRKKTQNKQFSPLMKF